MADKRPPLQALFAPFSDFLAHTLTEKPPTASQQAVQLGSGALVEHLGSGVLRIQPALPPTRQLIISAGLHGNETAPIEVCNDLVTELLEERWLVQTRTLIVLGNPPAMVAGQRFVDYNLNRLFAGAHEQPYLQQHWEAGRAAELERLVESFVKPDLPLFHYDLHTAIRDSKREKFALYPFVPNRQLPLEQAQFLLDCGVGTVLHQHKAGTTFASWTSTRFGAESFTVELGKVRPFGQNDRTRFEGVEQSLRRFMMGQWPIPGPQTHTALDEFRVVHEILNTGDGFVFHIADDVANFTEFAPGTLIWEDGKHQYRVGARPEAIVFPNPRVPVGQRVGLMIAPVTEGAEGAGSV